MSLSIDRCCYIRLPSQVTQSVYLLGLFQHSRFGSVVLDISALDCSLVVSIAQKAHCGLLATMFCRPPSPFHRTHVHSRRFSVAVFFILSFLFWRLYVICVHQQPCHQQAAQSSLSANRVFAFTAQRETERPWQHLKRECDQSQRYTRPNTKSTTSATVAVDKVSSAATHVSNFKPTPSNERSSASRVDNYSRDLRPRDTRGAVESETRVPDMDKHKLRPGKRAHIETGSSTSSLGIRHQGASRKNMSRFPSHGDPDPDRMTKEVNNARHEHNRNDPSSPVPALEQMTPWSRHYKFPDHRECEDVKEKADALPDMVFVPFEDAITDVNLSGWEDLWVSKARYTGPKLAEPMIDFVYNCTLLRTSQ
jgi:hypothetical protein